MFGKWEVLEIPFLCLYLYYLLGFEMGVVPRSGALWFGDNRRPIESRYNLQNIRGHLLQ